MPTDTIATGFPNLHMTQLIILQVSIGCMLLLQDLLYLLPSLAVLQQHIAIATCRRGDTGAGAGAIGQEQLGQG